MTISISVARETITHEKRVAMVPKVAEKLTKLGAGMIVAKGAGEGSRIPDTAYGESVTLSGRADQIYTTDIVLAVNAPEVKQINKMKQGSILVSFVQGHNHPDVVEALVKNKVTCFAMELIPRISRSQSMDALSSQANAAGYKAALLAADALERFFPMLTTAAGTIRPAKVLVIGAGVAGLQAIATAGRLGAKVYGYDVRTDTKEQVESLGAEFLVAKGIKAEGEGGYARELTDEEKAQQQQMLADSIAEVDAVITTAAIPGRPSPKIVSTAMVEAMKPGAVVIDLAAAGGGNCELTEPDQIVTHGAVTIHGPSNMPSLLAEHASEMYAQNLFNLLKLILVEEDGQEDVKPDDKTYKIDFDWEDEILAKSVLTHDGELVNERVKAALAQADSSNNDQKPEEKTS